MTAPMAAPPPDLSYLIPSKWKTVVGLIGSALSFAVPYVLQVTDGLPDPWPVVIGIVLFILTTLGVYRAPYKPADTVLVHKSEVPKGTPTDEMATAKTPPVVNPVGPAKTDFRNPWKR
jgi:hypothetical protein